MWLALPQSINFFDGGGLSPVERERLATRRNQRRRHEFAVSRALMAQVGITPNAITSLTHGDGLAALACGPATCGTANGAIGVDLERHRPRDVLGLARFAFSPVERAALAALPQTQRTRRFYTLWVIKEALAKALRIPLLDACERCVMTHTSQGWRGTVPTAQPWQLVVFEPEPDLSVAVVYVGTDVQLRISCFEWPPLRNVMWPIAAQARGFDPTAAGTAGNAFQPLSR